MHLERPAIPTPFLTSSAHLRFGARLLLAATVLGVGACSGSKNEPAPQATTAQAARANAPATPTPSAAPTPAPVAEPAPTPLPVVAAPTGPYAVPPYGTEPACPGSATEDDDLVGPTFDAFREGRADLAELSSYGSPCFHRSENLAALVNQGGLVHHGQGDFERSATWFAAAVRVSPLALAPRYNLMCALSKLGQVDAALAQLTELRRAGPAAADRLARVARDSDLEAMRSDPRFAAVSTAPVDVVTVAPNPLGLYAPRDFVVPTRAPIAAGETLPPAFASTPAIKAARLSWGALREQLGYARGLTLSFEPPESESAASAPAPEGPAPTADTTPAEPPTPLGEGYAPIERVTWWSPAPGVVFLVVPVAEEHLDGPYPERDTVDLYRFENGQLVLAGSLTTRKEWNESCDVGLARGRSAGALYFYSIGDCDDFIGEISFAGGRLVRRDNQRTP